MGKILNKCEFGAVHSTANCRCISDHVEVRQVKCSVPALHSKQMMDEVETGDKILKSLRARLTETVDAYFGDMVMGVIKTSLVDSLEKNVSEWFIEAAEEVRKVHGSV